MPPATDFVNPITGSAYRLRLDGTDVQWRVSKVVAGTGGSPVLRHLRVAAADGIPPPAAAIDLLVRGDHQPAGSPIVADPVITFGEAVLLDLDRTASVLMSMAREARERRITGTHGFRPGCGVLRQQERVAMEQATGACQELANAWSSSGLAATPGLIGLPVWLAAAMEDQAALTHLPAPISAIASLIQQAR